MKAPITWFAIFTTALLTLACSRENTVPESVNVDIFSVPDFTLRYEKGNGDFFDLLQRTSYELKGSNLRVTFKYPKESRFVQTTLTDEQRDTLWKSLSQLDLKSLAEPAEDLHDRCRHRETDQPYSELELTANGFSLKIVNDFDEKRCPELADFENFIDELPSLLGNPLPPESNKK